MSYDLHFLRPHGRSPLSVSDLRSYFATRDHFTLNDDQAFYEHPDTGVYFYFEGGAQDEVELDEADDDLDFAGVSFNLNYWRPHIFALEAEPEVRAFVERFDLMVDDPQTDGMGRGTYSSDGFLAGWNTGNRFAYETIQEQLDEPAPALPYDEIERDWNWNRRVKTLQEQLGDDFFVPPVSFVLQPTGVASYVIWGDAIPTALPKTDLLVLGRENLGAKRRLFGRRQLAASWLKRADVGRLFALGTPSEDGTYVLFSQWPPPEPVVEAFLGPVREIGYAPLSNDEVRDAELLAETKR